MNIDEYQKQTERTASKDPNDTPILAMGLAGEVGEAIDMLKKHLGHGHELDIEKFKKELGDITWYVVRLAARFDILMSDVCQANLDKLNKRYPDGFSVEASKNRKE